MKITILKAEDPGFNSWAWQTLFTWIWQFIAQRTVLEKVVDDWREKHLNMLAWLVRPLPWTLPQLGHSSSILFGKYPSCSKSQADVGLLVTPFTAICSSRGCPYCTKTVSVKTTQKDKQCCVKKFLHVELSQPCSSVVRASARTVHCTKNGPWKGRGSHLNILAWLVQPLPKTLPQIGQSSSNLFREYPS